MKAYSNIRPETVEPVGNGSYLYNYDITEHERRINETSEEGDSTKIMTETEYCYESVTVWSPLTPNRITEAVITDRYDNNYEQKLINEYNTAMMGLYQSEDEKTKRIEAYRKYLIERDRLKNLVDGDCARLSIEE